MISTLTWKSFPSMDAITSFRFNNFRHARTSISNTFLGVSYFILPYDIEDLEILIGKWYNLDGSKTQNVYIKRIR
jgi:hypothetical protein